MYTHIYSRMIVYMYTICMHACMHVCVCMYAYMYVVMHRLCICKHISIDRQIIERSREKDKSSPVSPHGAVPFISHLF